MAAMAFWLGQRLIAGIGLVVDVQLRGLGGDLALAARYMARVDSTSWMVEAKLALAFSSAISNGLGRG